MKNNKYLDYFRNSFITFGLYATIIGFLAAAVGCLRLFFDDTTEKGSAITILAVGVAVIVVGIVFMLQREKHTLTDGEYDSLVRDAVKPIKNEAMRRFGVTAADLSDTMPAIEFEGYEFVNASKIKVGEDNRFRSNLFEKTVILVTEERLYYFETITDVLTGVVSENEGRYKLSEIDSVSVSPEVVSVKRKTVTTASFRLAAADGKIFYASLSETGSLPDLLVKLRTHIK